MPEFRSQGSRGGGRGSATSRPIQGCVSATDAGAEDVLAKGDENSDEGVHFLQVAEREINSMDGLRRQNTMKTKEDDKIRCRGGPRREQYIGMEGESPFCVAP